MAFSRRKTFYDEPALYEYAVGALARQMRSVVELKRLLRRRVTGQDQAEALVEAVVLRLKNQHYLNDSQFAAAYSGYRRENEKFGRLRVVSDLKNKGVHGDIIAKTVGEVYAGVDEEKLARQYLTRKRMRQPEDGRQAAKIFRALARAGFTTKVIVAILKKWEVDDEVISVLESEDVEAGE
jgi:regulatory protein